jgi:hypothetical protein
MAKRLAADLLGEMVEAIAHQPAETANEHAVRPGNDRSCRRNA